MNFITRKGAIEKLKRPLLGPNPSPEFKRVVDLTWCRRMRNYELEERLRVRFGGEWCIAEWCPYNGRFCLAADYIDTPHPPLRGIAPRPPETDIPWRDFDGRLTETYRATDADG